MRWGLSWGAQAPHHITVAGTRYEVRTTKIAGVWTAYGTVNGVCVEAPGNDEREARQKWQAKVQAMTPLLEVERRMEDALDEAAAALDDAAREIAAADSMTGEMEAATVHDPLAIHLDEEAADSVFGMLDRGPLDSGESPPNSPPVLPPETCEIPRSVGRRLRPRMRRER